MVGEQPDTPVNGILLRGDVHAHFNKGNLYILPAEDHTDDSAYVSCMEIYWKGSSAAGEHILTHVPLEPAAQIDIRNGVFRQNIQSPRRLNDGDKMYLFTNDPLLESLPDYGLLLSTQARIWQFIALAGQTSTMVRIEKRIDNFIRSEARSSKAEERERGSWGRSNGADKGSDGGFPSGVGRRDTREKASRRQGGRVQTTRSISTNSNVSKRLRARSVSGGQTWKKIEGRKGFLR